MKIRLALGRRAASASQKCSAPEAYEQLVRERVRTGRRPVVTPPKAQILRFISAANFVLSLGLGARPIARLVI